MYMFGICVQICMCIECAYACVCVYVRVYIMHIRFLLFSSFVKLNHALLRRGKKTRRREHEEKRKEKDTPELCLEHTNRSKSIGDGGYREISDFVKRFFRI